MRILIVDDEPVSREKALAILSSYGDCRTASTGEEALAAFLQAHDQGQPFDYITLDIELPDISGIQVLRGIRKYEDFHKVPWGKGAKILMVTASSDATHVMPSFREGCEAYIVKPFSLEKLAKALFNI